MQIGGKINDRVDLAESQPMTRASMYNVEVKKLCSASVFFQKQGMLNIDEENALLSKFVKKHGYCRKPDPRCLEGYVM